jgi:anti-sigma-K factor RskA
MTHPSDDALAGLLLGDPEVAASIAEHVVECDRCQEVLADLTDVQLLLHEYADIPRPQPDPAVWERIVRATDASSGVARADRLALRRSRPSRAVPSRRGIPTWVGLAAAAALVVAGFGIGRLTEPRAADAARTVASATLTSLDGARGLGSAEVVDLAGISVLHVHPDQSLTPSAGYVEVWLINMDGKRMVSIGVLDPGRDASLPIPPGALAQGYRIVDLSNEQYDDKPAHSGDSIMRGTLPV